MTMQDLHSNVAPVQALPAQTINQATGALVSADVDLAGFNAAQVVVHFGDIVELGASPVGSAQIAVTLEHAGDDGTGAPGPYSAVAAADVIGVAAVSGGIVATVTSDLVPMSVGYVGDRRFIRITLTPTGLTSGGPAGVIVNKGHPRHAPVQAS
ncbi:MAG: hypothetical protein D6826_07960 [Alphaproteobacteria bacterium]|nr:MAG: hypothetical protein D6826_07960 [Alphaproteobacteria bacterium]